MQNQVVSREEWLKTRLDLLAAEKEFTRRRDDLTRRRMAMPWVQVEKDYRFEGPDGTRSLAELFEGRSVRTGRRAAPPARSGPTTSMASRSTWPTGT